MRSFASAKPLELPEEARGGFCAATAAEGQTQIPWLSDLFLTGKCLLAAYKRDGMKILLSLSVLCVTLALCHAACFRTLPKAEIRNGVIMPQEGCIDPYDGKRHPSGSMWNTDHCLRCECNGGGMECCHRYGGIARGPAGCEAVVNPETCRYEFHRIDNPSEPCF